MRYRYREPHEMEDSGVDWLGMIPKEWNKITLRRITTLKQGLQIDKSKRFIEDGANRLPYITIKFLNSKNKDHEIEFIENADKGVICHPDDILVARTGSTGEVVTDVSGVFHNNFFKVIYDKNKVVKEYLVYTLKEKKLKEQLLLKAGTTTIPDLNHGSFLETECLLFSKEEQQKIVEFLNLKITGFDSVIEKKEELIRKLEEAKKILISEIVTGKKVVYRNENGELKVENRAVHEMKDSGVEWLGAIPEQWGCVPLKYFVIVNPKKSEIQIEKNKKCTFVPMENVRTGKLELNYEKEISEVYDGYTYFKNDDIVMAKVTPCFENGNIAIAKNLKNGIGFGSTELFIFRSNDEIKTEFLYYLLQEDGFVKAATSRMTGAGGLKRVPGNFLLNLKLPLPMREIQNEIIEYLEKKQKSIDKIINLNKIQIKKLKEAKESLISEVVTGKIEIID